MALASLVLTVPHIALEAPLKAVLQATQKVLQPCSGGLAVGAGQASAALVLSPKDFLREASMGPSLL